MASTFYLPDCLTREGRMFFYQRFRVPKLFRYAKNLEWNKICKRCQESPRVAAKEAGFQNEYAPNETPLHIVLHPFFLLGNEVEFSQGRDSIEKLVHERHLAAAALLNVNKDAAMKTCCLGTCPLTLVAMDPYGTVEDVKMLVSASPKSARLQDLEGRTPLHYACITNRSSMLMIRALICGCPEAAQLKEKQGRLPLHYACMAIVMPSESMRSNALAHGFGEVLAEENCKAPLCTPSVVALLLDVNEKAVCAVDKEDKTPLHHLCRYIQALNGKQPEVLTSTDLIAVLCLLVERNPKVALQPDKDGFKPKDVIGSIYDQSESWTKAIEETDQKPNSYLQQHEALHRIANLVNEIATS